MHKRYLRKQKMSEALYLDNAARWSRELTRMKARGPGDTENAMRQIEREYGVDYWLLWRLRYRLSALKDIGVSAYVALKQAYDAECARQMRKLQHEIEQTEETAGADDAAVVAAKALVDQTQG